MKGNIGNMMKQAQQLQANIEQVFRSTMPDTRMVQPMFQMEEKVRDISDRLRAFGGVSGAQLSGLQTLREISMRAPSELSLNVDSLTITSTTVDLSGVTFLASSGLAVLIGGASNTGILSTGGGEGA